MFYFRYHHTYNTKKSVIHYYHCSQNQCLAKKPKKHSDLHKHHDKQSIVRYDCKGYIKITIYEDLATSNIEMQHFLHQTRPDISISPEIKQFIQDNIDLLPREIYKRLIEHGLNINIRQKQVHFW